MAQAGSVFAICAWTAYVCVTVGLSVVKISVSFLFLRLATKKAYCVFLWGVILFMVAFGIASVEALVRRKTYACWRRWFICEKGWPINIFQYVPIQAGWDIRLRPPPAGEGNAKCFSGEVFAQIGLFNSINNIATDFLLVLLPISLIWHLRVNIRTRCCS